MPLETELWRGRAVRFLAGASGTLVTALASVLRNKWLATHLEASGIGVVAQIVTGQVWLGILVGLGLGLPVTRAVGAAAAAGDAAAARRVVWTALALTAAAAVPVSAAGLLFAEPISHALLGTPEHGGLVRLSMIGVLGFGLYSIVQAATAGRSDVRAPLAFALGGGGLATALTFVLVPRFGLPGAILAIALLYPAGAAAMLLVHRRRHPGALFPRARPLVDRGEAKALLAVAGAALLLPLVDQGTLLALRAHYVRANGVAANGLLQAALALSQQVGALFYVYLASYAFGKISGTSGAAAIEAYTRRQWSPLVLLAAALTALSMVAATPLLHLLYSDRFDAARPMMAFALFGEFARVLTQTAALGALPRGGVRLWLAIGVVQPITLALAYALFAGAGAGDRALPYAYAAGGLATFVVAASMMVRAGVALGARRLGLAAASFAALGALLLVTGR